MTLVRRTVRFDTRTVGMAGLGLAVSLLLTGCTTALVRDDVRYPKTQAHCSGSQGVDDSSIAVLPVPVVAFVVPHVNLHDIKADDYLKRCGDSTKLINRKVEVNRTACIPAGLTAVGTRNATAV